MSAMIVALHCCCLWLWLIACRCHWESYEWDGDWTEAAACIMGGISARPSARYSGITMDSDLNVTREASCDKQLSPRGILLSSFIFVPSLWILSAAFVASLSLCCRGPAPGGQRGHRTAPRSLPTGSVQLLSSNHFTMEIWRGSE